MDDAYNGGHCVFVNIYDVVCAAAPREILPVGHRIVPTYLQRNHAVDPRRRTPKIAHVFGWLNYLCSGQTHTIFTLKFTFREANIWHTL